MRIIHRPLFWFIMIVLLLSLAGAAQALVSPQAVTRHVLGSAGQPVTAGTWILNGTLGEPVAGAFVSADEQRLASGFWHGIVLAFKLFLPLISKY
jgi:hypothetical protein